MNLVNGYEQANAASREDSIQVTLALLFGLGELLDNDDPARIYAVDILLVIDAASDG
jgi:hypothetical protein